MLVSLMEWNDTIFLDRTRAWSFPSRQAFWGIFLGDVGWLERILAYAN
jgi:hypothetical protein